jgi:hypothetical protein
MTESRSDVANVAVIGSNQIHVVTNVGTTGAEHFIVKIGNDKIGNDKIGNDKIGNDSI